MRRTQINQTLKLRLLALVLALALIWYSLDPAPRPVIRKKREAEPPDVKKRNIEPRSMPVTSPPGFSLMKEMADSLLSPDEDVDDFEWPEFIDG